MSALLVLVLTGCNDYNLNGKAVHDGKYNPPDLAVEPMTDNITQVTVPAVDVLWVVDNSGSMSEEQRALRENFPDFMRYFTDSGLDFHVGVVSTDMDNRQQSGKLVQDDSKGKRYIDTSFTGDEAVSSFQERANLGTLGSSDERGKDAAYGALVTERDDTNAGFYRDEASLSIVLISDEPDYSRISTNEFVSWMLGLKAEEGMVSFSSIIGPTPGGCATAEQGRGYHEVTQQVGGIEESICTNDWSPVLTELGLQAAGLKREFFLTEIPVESSLSVSIKNGSDETEYEVDKDWTYSRSRNSITFVEVVPDPLSVVAITYLPLEEEAASLEEGAGDTGS